MDAMRRSNPLAHSQAKTAKPVALINSAVGATKETSRIGRKPNMEESIDMIVILFK